MKSNETKTIERKQIEREEMIAKIKKWFYIISFIFSSFVFIQNWFISEKLNNLKEGQAEIRDEQDAQITWKLVGLKDTAKKLESGYLHLKEKEAKYIEHCKQNPCNLPIELKVAEADIKYDSIELIVAGNALQPKPKEK